MDTLFNLSLPPRGLQSADSLPSPHSLWLSLLLFVLIKREQNGLAQLPPNLHDLFVLIVSI